MLVRHGETQWSRAHKHTGRTDVPLTPFGERQARALAPALASRRFTLVLASPLRRAWRTAELAGLPDPVPEPGLQEWDYGAYEGLTSEQIRAERGDEWFLWTDGVPAGDTPGEDAAAVGRRLDVVLRRVRSALPGAAGDIALVGHGHALRALGARWAGWPVTDGGRLLLDTAATCVLGVEHDRPAIASWNLANPARRP